MTGLLRLQVIFQTKPCHPLASFRGSRGSSAMPTTRVSSILPVESLQVLCPTTTTRCEFPPWFFFLLKDAGQTDPQEIFLFTSVLSLLCLSVQTSSVLGGLTGAFVWRSSVPAVGTIMERTHSHEQLHGHTPDWSWTDLRSGKFLLPPNRPPPVNTTFPDYITCSICLEEAFLWGILNRLRLL